MKTKFDDLAIFGGKPAFEEKLHVGSPNIGDRQRLLERINSMLDRRWLTNNGPFVKEFEQGIANMHGVKHCIAVCNATVGLEIAIKALGMAGEVIIPSMTFIATAHALQWQGIKPVFCDIDPQTYNIDPRKIEEHITSHTTGIIGVHLFGRPCDVVALADIAKRYHLRLLYDSAHAIGCSKEGTMIGNFGDAEVYSFHATKVFNTLEGGAIATNDDDLAAKVQLMRNFGFASYDNVIYIGINGKMNEMSAAMGLTSLESLEDFFEVNHHNYKQYQRELAEVPGISLISYNEREKFNYQYIVLEVDEAETMVSRDQLIAILWTENVLARRYFFPGCHRMEPYRTYYPDAGASLPVTERLSERILSLPNGTAIGSDDISRICQVIRFVIANGREIAKCLQDLNIPTVYLPASKRSYLPEINLYPHGGNTSLY
jgi:dTDP-4-amino-4,6-dideoxygalactose transaminase